MSTSGGPTPDGRRTEAALLLLGGATLGYVTGRVWRLPLLGAIIGGLNGALAGHRRTYDLASGGGRLAFLLDSTWALPTTAAGTAVNLANAALSDSDYLPELSERRNRHVYGNGVRVRRQFATTFGNTVTNSSAAGTYDLREESATAERRRLLIEEHEDLHVWQARWFGPLFPLLYGGWMVAGAVAGFLGWLRHGGSLGKAIETVSYYDNPFEFWAYVANRYWPPKGVHPKLVWKTPKHLHKDRSGMKPPAD